jgi:uncharacterized protein Veg
LTLHSRVKDTKNGTITSLLSSYVSNFYLVEEEEVKSKFTSAATQYINAKIESSSIKVKIRMRKLLKALPSVFISEVACTIIENERYLVSYSSTALFYFKSA